MWRRSNGLKEATHGRCRRWPDTVHANAGVQGGPDFSVTKRRSRTTYLSTKILSRYEGVILADFSLPIGIYHGRT